MNQKQFGMQGKKLIKNLKNLNTFTFILIFFSILLYKNGFAKENYVVSIVNKIPLTKIDIINRAKLIAFSVEKNYEFKSMLLDKLISGKFQFEFLPEDEIMKENYIISNGYVSINPDKKITNSRIIIRI